MKSSIASVIEPIYLAAKTINAGERKRIDIAVVTLFDRIEMVIPVELIRGKKDDPVLFVSATIHGNEITGVEAIKCLLVLVNKRIRVNRLCGTLIAVPIVTVFGFSSNARYLPDLRNLNRCFPGLLMRFFSLPVLKILKL